MASKRRKSTGWLIAAVVFISGVFLAPQVKPHIDKILEKGKGGNDEG